MIKKDEWLSEQILKNSYYFSINDLSIKTIENEWDKFKRDHKQENLFVYSKIRTNVVSVWHCLEKEGFKLIDTNVKFELQGILSNNGEQRKDIQICFAKNKHQKAIGKIARDNFIYSRFHLDPLIGNDIANQIKQNWVENYFYGKRGDKMVLALINDNPVGFLQLIVKKKELLIDLIGVDNKAQGKGVASAMINFASKTINHSLIKVGTQIGNTPSIKLYQKLGFLFSGSDYVFHYHSQ